MCAAQSVISTVSEHLRKAWPSIQDDVSSRENQRRDTEAIARPCTEAIRLPAATLQAGCNGQVDLPDIERWQKHYDSDPSRQVLGTMLRRAWYRTGSDKASPRGTAPTDFLRYDAVWCGASENLHRQPKTASRMSSPASTEGRAPFVTFMCSTPSYRGRSRVRLGNPYLHIGSRAAVHSEPSAVALMPLRCPRPARQSCSRATRASVAMEGNGIWDVGVRDIQGPFGVKLGLNKAKRFESRETWPPRHDALWRTPGKRQVCRWKFEDSDGTDVGSRGRLCSQMLAEGTHTKN